MSEICLIRFNIKFSGNTLSQKGAGIQTKDTGTGDKNLIAAGLEYLTANSIGLNCDVGDLVVYGGAQVKSGPCCGYLVLKFRGDYYVVSPNQITCERLGNSAFFRFNFISLNYRSTVFVENGY